ncbi:TetR family transcriptional regulator [Paraburkholderia silvatlantica]|uniref:TetR family transcriptional regulator n=1 Tax=Paraburkholderia silvatlantica TaxID=321895 RepID=A0A2V4TY77_9BURK|nr:TetR/AcrR family transcriptional regulator [Paraburkholderia silvatlantica]PYE23133.1 TetR family transcriptional regulator [Paraburkholderia silvatlantica]
MENRTANNQATQSTRRETFLNAAIQVFARYGYRKTSIDQIAQAAGASRQGLYLHFSSKEELFRATVEHALSQHLRAVTTALSQDRPLADRLVAACDEWAGRYVGTGTQDAQDLVAASTSITSETLAAYGMRFEEALAEAIADDSKVMRAYIGAGLTAKDVARTLHMVTQGIKQRSSTRQEFVTEISTSVAVLMASTLRLTKGSS